MAERTNSQKRQEWLDRLARFRRTRQTVAEFCRNECVSVHSFYHWRRKLAGAGLPPAKRGSETAEPAFPKFTPLQLTPRATAAITVRLPGGVLIDVASDAAAREVLDRLLGPCRGDESRC